VPEIKQHKAVARFCLLQETYDIAGDFKKAFAGRFDRQHRACDRLDPRGANG
jgi:hypothetical protein